MAKLKGKHDSDDTQGGRKIQCIAFILQNICRQGQKGWGSDKPHCVSVKSEELLEKHFHGSSSVELVVFLHNSFSD